LHIPKGMCASRADLPVFCAILHKLHCAKKCKKCSNSWFAFFARAVHMHLVQPKKKQKARVNT